MPASDLGAAAAGGQHEAEGWRVRKDGSRLWARVGITALRDEAGGLRGFATVTRDVTDRKEAEVALRRAHDELERRVLGRTAELAGANRALQAEVAERVADQPTQHRRAGGHAVAPEHPDDTDDTDRDEAHHDHVDGGLGPGHAAVEERETWCHQQHERRSDDDPDVTCSEFHETAP